MFIGLPKGMDISTEAVSFQGASKLAIELAELFQSVMDYRDSIRGTSKKIQADVFEFHRKNVPGKFKDIVKKHTGLIVNDFITSPHLDFGYACLMSFGEDAEKGNILAYDAIAKYSGQPSDYIDDYVGESEEDIVKALENVSGIIDLAASKLKTSEFAGIDKVDKLFCNLYFCYISAYLMKDVVHQDSDEFTGAEIAAIMIHEIGHMLSAVEHAGDVVRTHQSVMGSVNVAKVPGASATNIAKAAYSGLSKVKKGVDKEDMKRMEALENSASNVEEIPEKSGLFGRALSIVIELISLAITLVTALVGMVILRLFMLVFGANTELSDILSMYKKKRSDFMTNFGDRCLCERYADEFVSRHGFAQYQVSALGKLYEMIHLSYKTSDGNGSRESTVVYRIAQFKVYVLMHMFGLGEDTDGSYENDANRALSMMRDVLKVFKETNMPPDLLDFYIKNYEDTVKAVEKYRPKGLAKKLLAINVFLTKTATFPSLIKLIVAGRADSNYKQLVEAAQTLSSNKLHYFRAKLDQLYRMTK